MAQATQFTTHYHNATGARTDSAQCKGSYLDASLSCSCHRQCLVALCCAHVQPVHEVRNKLTLLQQAQHTKQTYKHVTL